MKRKGLSFYSLRHTFETIGGAAKDQIAVDAIMGHVTPGMGTNYRDSVDDGRLRAVTDHVHAWLFPQGGANPDLEDFARQLLELKGQ
jgi:integrase